ncbi:MAG: hypothetical protein WA840_01675 [Caulobacteraceae bacterium]
MNDPTLDVAPATGPRNDPFGEGVAAAKARRARSLGIAFALLAFVVVVFIVSMIKLAAATHVPGGVHTHCQSFKGRVTCPKSIAVLRPASARA